MNDIFCLVTFDAFRTRIMSRWHWFHVETPDHFAVCNVKGGFCDASSVDLLSCLQSHLLPISLSNMNSLRLSPCKDYEANRLLSGRLQLSSGTHLLLDETALENGQLDTQGEVLGHCLFMVQILFEKSHGSLCNNKFVRLCMSAEFIDEFCSCFLKCDTVAEGGECSLWYVWRMWQLLGMSYKQKLTLCFGCVFFPNFWRVRLSWEMWWNGKKWQSLFWYMQRMWMSWEMWYNDRNNDKKFILMAVKNMATFGECDQ